MSKITVAKTAGFCFGVDRAVNIVYDLIKKGESACTLGPIIHNPQLVEELAAKGVRVVSSVDEVQKNETLVIRSHGVTRQIMDDVKQRKIKYIDATCPFVSKIHKIVSAQSEKGHNIIIAGDESHPEVQGIMSHCKTKVFAVKKKEELEELFNSNKSLLQNSLSFVAQTTFSTTEWEKFINLLNLYCTNAIIFDTICNATSKRQKEAFEISKGADVMIVIGGRCSSNTAKLRDVCQANADTYLIETKEGLPLAVLRNAQNIGVTAGASTPAGIIKEVLETMSEILNVGSGPVVESATGRSEDEMSFSEILEESFKNFSNDQKVKGVVLGITPTEVQVDIGRKHAGYVPLDELTNDPNAKPEDIVKVGDVIDLIIMRTNDQEGTVTLSKRRFDAIEGWENIIKAEEDGSIVEGTVTEVIKGGVLAVTNNVRVFIPASLATANRGDALEDLVGKKVRFRVIEVNRQRRRAVGSIRSVLREEKKEQEEAFWSTIQKGAVYNGVVKSLTSYGAFVDLGGVDGMIHVSELSWTRVKHPSEVVNIGDNVEVYVKDVDFEKKKISLGYRKTEDNPWEILKRDYPVGTVVDAKVVGITTFGAFAQIIPGLDGLIHISQIANRHVNKPEDELSIGQEVKAKITEIDFDKKRVSLSIRELLPKEEVVTEESPSEDASEEAAADEEIADAPIVDSETDKAEETAE